MSDRHSISPYPVRMPASLRERLEESARAGARSLHAEIISRLEASYDYIPSGSGLSPDQSKAELDEIRREELVLATLKKGKLAGIHQLNEALDTATSPEQKAALNAALSVANGELDALFDRSSELRNRTYAIRGQEHLSEIAEALSETGESAAESMPTLKRSSRAKKA